MYDQIACKKWYYKEGNREKRREYERVHFHLNTPEYREKIRFRDKDRKWFIHNLGKEYMKQFEIHHEWEKGAKCILLTTKEHKRLEGREW